MRTAAFFGKIRIFQIYGVSAWTRGEGVNFCEFVRKSFMEGPLPDKRNILLKGECKTRKS